MRATLVIDPPLHVLRELHFLISFLWNSARHGFSASADSGLPVTTVKEPSALISTLTIESPALRACLTTLSSVGLFRLRTDFILALDAANILSHSSSERGPKKLSRSARR